MAEYIHGSNVRQRDEHKVRAHMLHNLLSFCCTRP
jgi:hypothetical protein